MRSWGEIIRKRKEKTREKVGNRRDEKGIPEKTKKRKNVKNEQKINTKFYSVC